MLTYVSAHEFPSNPTDVQVGLLGRDQPHADARELKIVHVEEGKRDA